MTNSNPTRPLLEVKNLRTSFFGKGGEVKASDDVSLTLDAGETLGLVGESGCGKSVTALSIMRLIPEPQGRILGGEVWLDGVDLLSLPETEMRDVRGAQIGMIFQEPLTSLNPVLSIGRQLTETLEIHLGMSKRAALSRAAELLQMVHIPDAASRLSDYPHQFSGGQRQRVMIAIALSCNPKLIIADEATTALDVTIQAQILELVTQLTKELGTALMIITHNLGVVARYADRVNVMYAGKIRESGGADEIYNVPSHPYTAGLLNAVPRLDRPKGSRLQSIEGEIPDMADLPGGCAYRPRCPYAVDQCATDDPPLVEVGDGHTAACWEWRNVASQKGQPVMN
jgi:oligopeptide transport system ATP-binding protein